MRPAPARSRVVSRTALWAGLLGVFSTAALLAPTAALAKDPPLPSPEQLRQLQLLTLACGRDNAAAPCEQARAMADPLLDHPRLGGTCKDTLWTIREHAVVATSNSFERRQRLNRAGSDVTIFCRPQSQPVRPSSSDNKDGGNQRRGFGLIPNS